MTQVFRRSVAGALVLVVSLLVPALTSSAEAALPTKNTTYKGDFKDDGGDLVTVTIRVGASRTTIAKFTVKAECYGGSESLVVKNIHVDQQGKFRKSKGFANQVDGRFVTKNKVKGNVFAQICNFVTGQYTAKD